jgi:hypothetical protein
MDEADQLPPLTQTELAARKWFFFRSIVRRRRHYQ